MRVQLLDHFLREHESLLMLLLSAVSFDVAFLTCLAIQFGSKALNWLFKLGFALEFLVGTQTHLELTIGQLRVRPFWEDQGQVDYFRFFFSRVALWAAHLASLVLMLRREIWFLTHLSRVVVVPPMDGSLGLLWEIITRLGWLCDLWGGSMHCVRACFKHRWSDEVDVQPQVVVLSILEDWRGVDWPESGCTRSCC